MGSTIKLYVSRIRRKLEEDHLREISKHRNEEVEHRQEIIRILSSQNITQPIGHVGDGDTSENLALISGYQQENERLYQKTKGATSINMNELTIK